MQITLTYNAADDIITLSVFYLKQSELGRISFLKKKTILNIELILGLLPFFS